MLIWTCDDTFKFIEHYRSMPILWDPKISHRHKQKLHIAWEKISESMGIDVDNLKKKKEALMSTYRLLARKRRHALSTADGKEIDFNPSWMFFEPMDAFLWDIYKNGNAQNSKCDQNESEESEPTPSKHMKVDVPQPKKIKKRFKYITNASPNQNVETAKVNDDISKAQDDSTKKPDPDPQENDECGLYGKLLITKLRRFPESERQEIMLAIDSYIMEQARILRGKEQCQTSISSPNLFPGVSHAYSSPSLQGNSSLPMREVTSSSNTPCLFKIPKEENDIMVSSEDNPAQITVIEEVFCDSNHL